MIDGFLMGPSPLIQTVAREYDSTATYRVGDYCTRDGKIYKCTTAISTAEDFNTSHWEFVVICDEFASQLGIVEKTNTATHNITSGQYVIWKGLLYTASSTITSGDTLSDSNLTRVENGGLNSLSSKLKWKYLGDKTGLGESNAIEYPEDADELLIDLPWDNARGWRQTIHIKCLDESGTYGNIPASGYSASVYVNASNRKVYVSGINTPNGAFWSTNAKFYYR